MGRMGVTGMLDQSKLEGKLKDCDSQSFNSPSERLSLSRAGARGRKRTRHVRAPRSFGESRLHRSTREDE